MTSSTSPKGNSVFEGCVILRILVLRHFFVNSKNAFLQFAFQQIIFSGKPVQFPEIQHFEVFELNSRQIKVHSQKATNCCIFTFVKKQKCSTIPNCI